MRSSPSPPVPNGRKPIVNTLDARHAPARPDAAAHAGAPARRGQAAFSLVELLIVVTVIGILAAIAVPQFLVARRLAAERAVIATLKTMVADQQLFFLSPVPRPPSAMTDPGRRYARLHELNSFANSAFGATVADLYVDAPRVRYSMVPLWPTTASLRGRFIIQAAEQSQDKGFIYEVDESGRVVKIR